nr:MAG TPA: hypothetical protein [Caudoviricetes sp.]
MKVEARARSYKRTKVLPYPHCRIKHSFSLWMLIAEMAL